MNIQWYPGHMTKTKRIIKENLNLVDLVIEILDARAPISSRNPDVNDMIGNKPKLMIFNKADLSDSNINKQWEKSLQNNNMNTIFINSLRGQGIDKIVKTIEKMMEDKLNRLAQRGIKNKPIRCMIIGIPNVGKSTFINKIAGRSRAKTGNKPGITKGKQWIRINERIELLDTPGILWPKFEDQNVGIKLAWIGSIKEEILNIEELAFLLLDFLRVAYPDLLINRYKLQTIEKETLRVLDDIAVKRGFIIKRGQPDYERTCEMLLNEFRKGEIGKISLEKP